jgi:hypothetical protein
LTVFSVIFLILSFFEIIVFDEELLLAMCFICFIFFAYSYLNQSVDSIFSDRKAKIELDLLVAFDEKITQKQKYTDKLVLDKILLKKIQLISMLGATKIDLLFENTLIKYSSFLLSFTSNILKDVTATDTFIKSQKQQVKLERIFYMFLYKTQIK